MRLRRLAVTLAACCLQVRPAAADESINIFVAIDAAYYLGLVLCGMVRAYGEPSSAARRGRPFKFFVLHGPRLPDRDGKHVSLIGRVLLGNLEIR